jgi:hypothetical protein
MIHCNFHPSAHTYTDNEPTLFDDVEIDYNSDLLFDF